MYYRVRVISNDNEHIYYRHASRPKYVLPNPGKFAYWHQKPNTVNPIIYKLIAKPNFETDTIAQVFIEG